MTNSPVWIKRLICFFLHHDFDYHRICFGDQTAKEALQKMQAREIVRPNSEPLCRRCGKRYGEFLMDMGGPIL